jgi:hypothetical protein
MEHEKEKDKESTGSSKGIDKKERMREYLEEAAKHKKAPIAKDLVELTHVEIKKQQIPQETMDLATTLKERYLEHDHFERLSNDELTILESFMGKRLFLNRIAIVANQSRVPLGIPPFKKAELETILNKLMEKGYIQSEMVEGTPVYFLTERGKYRVQ